MGLARRRGWSAEALVHERGFKKVPGFEMELGEV